jgi:hypothetical protein
LSKLSSKISRPEQTLAGFFDPLTVVGVHRQASKLETNVEIRRTLKLILLQTYLLDNLKNSGVTCKIPPFIQLRYYHFTKFIQYVSA